MSNRAAVTIESQTAESFEVLAGTSALGLVVLCDHASNALPPVYDSLGLPLEDLQRHIAWDIGAAGVTRQISRVLGVPAVLTRYSRLLIDPNRGEDDPTLIMRLSDGAIIPGNRVLDADEREHRIARYYRPYHDAVRRVIERVSSSGRPPVLFGVHSFTDVWKGWPRPWHAGVLWDDDQRVSLPLLAALRAEGDLVVGDNEPYPGQYEGDTMWQHGTVPGRPFCSIEIRQDLIGDAAGQQAWGDRLARILGRLLDTPGVVPRGPG